MFSWLCQVGTLVQPNEDNTWFANPGISQVHPRTPHHQQDFSLQFGGIEKYGVNWQFLLELQNNKMPYEFTKYKGGDLDLKFYSTSNNFPLIFSR